MTTMTIWLKYEGSGDIPDKYLKDEKAVANDKLRYLKVAEEEIECAIYVTRVQFDTEKQKCCKLANFRDSHLDYNNSYIRTMNKEINELIDRTNNLLKELKNLEEIQKSKDRIVDWYCTKKGIVYYCQQVEE